MHQSTTPSLSKTIWPRWASRQLLSLPIVQTLPPMTFGYSLSSEAVVMRELRRWKRLWWRSLTRSHKRVSMGPFRSRLNGTSALSRGRFLLRGLEFHVYNINKSAHTKNVWKLILCASYINCSYGQIPISFTILSGLPCPTSRRRCPWCSRYRRREMNTATRVQILDETDCISHSTNTLGKGMNPIIFPPAMGK